MSDIDTTTDSPADVPVSVPFPPRRIASCPMCGLDLTARSVHYHHGFAVCLDCIRHAYPAALGRYMRAFAHHVRRSDLATFRGLTFWIPDPNESDSASPSWLRYVPKSAASRLLAITLINPDWVLRDAAFDQQRRESAIGAICRDLADQSGEVVGGYEPRFKPTPAGDQAESLRRDVQALLGFD